MSKIQCPFHNTNHIQKFDALDTDARENPWPYYDWLREDAERRVYKLPDEKDFYVLHRYEDVKKAFADQQRLSSKIIPTRKGLFLALMDGENHRRIRNAIAPIFLPKNIDKRIPEIKATVQNATRDLVQKGNTDLLESWAIPIPLKILAGMFGLKTDAANIQQIYDQSLAINRAIFVTGGTGPRRKGKPNVREKYQISMAILRQMPHFYQLQQLIGWKGMRELAGMFRTVDEKAIPRPNFDALPDGIGPFLGLLIQLGTQLKQANENDSNALSTFNEMIQNGTATQVEMILAGAFILFAGHETSVSLLSNCFVHLARNPETFKKLKSNPEGLENFIEESLRIYRPVGRFLRRAKVPVQFGDQAIPKDAIIMLMPGAANTDPEKFSGGCAFDENRSDSNKHLSFGKGAHFCIGAYLARLTARMALEELLQQANHIAIDVTKPSQMVTDRDNGVFRYEQLSVVVG